MELTIALPQGAERFAMTGAGEINLKLIREALDVRITSREGELKLSGESDAVGRAAHVLNQLADAAKRQKPLKRQHLLELITMSEQLQQTTRNGMAQTDGSRDPINVDVGLSVYLRDRRIKPATPGQRTYLQAILDHDLTFCCGPAGTGKTYLAVAAAVSLLKRGIVRKLVLVRPTVEAGERLGFLPGTMQEKVNPYLRPLLDGLHDMMEFDQVARLMASDVIEIVPLAFMRGRTLNDSMIILDEAQNTTRSQMMMFLTRLGHGSKMVVTGDTSQTDLDDPRDSGLVDAVFRLRYTRGIAFATLDKHDIVRHSLVQRIVEAYDKTDKNRQRPNKSSNYDENVNSDR